MVRVSTGLLLIASAFVGAASIGVDVDMKPQGNLRKLGGGSGYDYEHPGQWKNSYPECGGNQQSPIDLPPMHHFSESHNEDIVDVVGQPLEMNYFPRSYQKRFPTAMSSISYEKLGDGNIKYTTHLTETWIETKVRKKDEHLFVGHKGLSLGIAFSHLSSYLTTPALTELIGRDDGDLDNMWKLEQIHFHWGENNHKGSEHTVGGKSYPLEVHLVHRNVQYASIGDALPHGDGLLVVGRFFDVGNKNKQIATMLKDIDMENFYADDYEHVKSNFDVTKLVNDNNGYMLSDYKLYPGSLTTPPCSEAVTWVVLNDVGTVSAAQLKQFRMLKKSHDNDERVTKNYRPTLPLKNREVISSHLGAHHYP